MASLLGWFKNEVGQVGHAIGGVVHGAEQGVGQAAQAVGHAVGGAAQDVGHAVQGAERAVQHVAPPVIPNFHLPVPVVNPVQNVLHTLQGLGTGLSNVAQSTANFSNQNIANPTIHDAKLTGQLAANVARIPFSSHAQNLQREQQFRQQAGLPTTGSVSPGQVITHGTLPVLNTLTLAAPAKDIAAGGVRAVAPGVEAGARAVARDLAPGGKLVSQTGAIGKDIGGAAKPSTSAQAAFEQSLTRPAPPSPLEISPKQALDMNVRAKGTYQPPGAPAETPPGIRFPVSQLKTLEAQGNAGKALAQKTVDVQTTNDRLGAASEAQIPTVLKITSKAESRNFQDVLRGTAEPATPKIAQAVKEWRAFSPGFRETGVKAGVRIGDRGPNYFPQNSNFTGDNYQNALDNLVKTGQARDTGEAIQMLDEIRSTPVVRRSDYFKQRTLDTGLNHDNVAAVAKNYISQGAKTIAETTHYGKSLGKLNPLFGQIQAEGGNAQQARKIINNLVSPEFSNSAGAKAIRGGRKLMSAAKLGTAVISHAGQPLLNDTAHAGITPTLKAYATRFTKANIQHVEDTGINYNVERQRQLEQSVGSRLSKITAPGLTSLQKFNRGVAAVAGKYAAESRVAKAAAGDTKSLEFLRNKLGIQGEIGRTLTPEQIIQAGRNEAVATHFSNNPAELPLFHSSELGKTVLQFRAAFGIKETGFIINEVLKEARAGNFGPLTRFAVMAPVVGTGVYAGKAAVSNVADQIFNGGKNQQALLPGSVLEAAAKGGGFGLPGSIAEGFKYTKTAGKLDKTKVLEALAGAAAPLAGEALKTGANAVDALNGKTQPLVHQAIGEVPIVGGGIANRLAPYQGGTTGVASGQPGGSASADLAKQVADNAANKAKNPDQNLKVEDYLTKDQQNYLKLTPDQQKAYLAANPDQAYLARSGDEKRAADQIINGVHPNLPAGLDAQSTKVLTNYDRLSAAGKSKYNDSPQNTYDLAVANYQKDLVGGNLNPEEQYTRQQALGQDKIKAGYSQEVVQLYGFSKAKLTDFFSQNPDKQNLFGQVQDLSSKLAGAGFTATDKFAKGLATTHGKGSKGGKAKVAKIPSFKTANAKKIAAPKGVKIKAVAYKPYKPKKIAVSKMPKIV